MKCENRVGFMGICGESTTAYEGLIEPLINSVSPDAPKCQHPRQEQCQEWGIQAFRRCLDCREVWNPWAGNVADSLSGRKLDAPQYCSNECWHEGLLKRLIEERDSSEEYPILDECIEYLESVK